MCFVFMATRYGSDARLWDWTPTPVLEGDVITTDCWGKVLELFLTFALHKMSPGGDIFLLSACVLYFVSRLRFFISSAPQQQETTEYEEILWFSFCTQFQGRTFPECSETTTWTRAGYSNRKLRDEPWVYTSNFHFFRKTPYFLFSPKPLL